MQKEKTICATNERKLIIDCCETALLAVLIAVSGTFRIPGIVPGTEFQLSAPSLSAGSSASRNISRQGSSLRSSGSRSERRRSSMWRFRCPSVWASVRFGF